MFIRNSPLSEQYILALIKIEEMQRATSPKEMVTVIDDLVHHLTRLSDGLLAMEDLKEGGGRIMRKGQKMTVEQRQRLSTARRKVPIFYGPPQLCACGCGEVTGFYYKTERKPLKREAWKGWPRLFVSGHNSRLLTSEEQSRRGKCSRKTWDEIGRMYLPYCQIRNKEAEAPYNKKGARQLRPISESSYIKVNGRHLHRIIAERAIGRRLTSKEVVHHINGNKHDNRNENLLICAQAYHAFLHGTGRIIND